MSGIHFFALSERWSSAANNDAFCAVKIGDYHIFGVAAGLSDRPGPGTASGIAISSLIDAVRGMKGSPAAALDAAVHDGEARIKERGVGSSSGISRDSTHLSACMVNDSLDSTILDTGEGEVLLVTGEGTYIPRIYPKASKPPDSGPRPSGRKKEIISHSLGEPHILNPSDFVAVNIRDLFLVISSGGLHDFVNREQIRKIVLANGENVETSCQQLVREAQRAGSERTITIVLVHGHLH